MREREGGERGRGRGGKKARHSSTKCVGGQHTVAYCCCDVIMGRAWEQQDLNKRRGGDTVRTRLGLMPDQ